jgi:hypothetical protein
MRWQLIGFMQLHALQSIRGTVVACVLSLLVATHVDVAVVFA